MIFTGVGKGKISYSLFLFYLELLKPVFKKIMTSLRLKNWKAIYLQLWCVKLKRIQNMLDDRQN